MKLSSAPKGFLRTGQALAVLATLGGAVGNSAEAQAGDFPSEGGSWKRPALPAGDVTDLYKRDPCLDPESKKPLTENGFAWLDGRTEKTPNGECHAARVLYPSKKERRDGVKIGIIGAPGDFGGGAMIMDRFAPQLHGVTFIEALRPGFCYPASKLCSSGKQSDNYNDSGQPIANRTPDKAESYRGLIQNIRAQYHLDVVLVFGVSGGNNILANAATQGNAEGGFFLGTTCDDQKWYYLSSNINSTPTANSHWLSFKNNVDQLDAIPKLNPDFVSVIMNGAKDDNTLPVLGSMCAEESQKLGQEAHFLSPKWLAHEVGFGELMNPGHEEELKAARKEIRDAWELLIEATVTKFKDRRKNRQAAGQ